jgi:hypothetical protein
MHIINDENPNYPVFFADKKDIECMSVIPGYDNSFRLHNGKLVKQRESGIICLAEVHCDKVSALADLGSLGNNLIISDIDSVREVGFATNDLAHDESTAVEEFRDVFYELRQESYYHLIGGKYKKFDKQFDTFLTRSMRNIKLDEFCPMLFEKYGADAVESFIREYLKTHYFQIRDCFRGNNFMLINNKDGARVDAGFDFECSSLFFRESFDGLFRRKDRKTVYSFFAQKLPLSSIKFIQTHYSAIWDDFVGKILAINSSDKLYELCDFSHLGKSIKHDQDKLSRLGESLFEFYNTSTRNFTR